MVVGVDGLLEEGCSQEARDCAAAEGDGLPPHVELAAGLEVPVHPAVDLRDAPGERGPAPGGHDLLVGGGDVGAVQGVQEGFWLPDDDVGVDLKEGVVGQGCL